MGRLLKIELNRAFINRLFAAALIIGGVLAVWQVIDRVIPILAGQDSYLEYPDKAMLAPGSVWDIWMGVDIFSLQSYLYFLLLPLLAVLPFADSYFSDCKTGYVKSVYTRAKKSSYIFAKLAAVFLSGGTAVVLPLLLNLGLTMMLLPSLMPVVSGTGTAIYDRAMWAERFYASPGLYTALYLLLIFVFSGFLAALALAVSFLVENRFVVLLGPFVLYLFIFALCSLLNVPEMSPMMFLNPGAPSGGVRFSVVAAETLLLGAVACGTFLYKGIRNETY